MNRLSDKILCFWIICGEIVPNAVLSFTEPLTAMARIANVLLPLGLIGLIVSATKRVGWIVWILLPLTLFAAFQIVCLSLYGSGIISVDMLLNVLTTNGSEVGELLARLWPSLLLLVILYVLPLALGVYCICKGCRLPENFMRLNRKVWGTVAIAGIACLGACYAQGNGYDVRRDLYPVNVGYNIYLTHDRCYQTKHYFETSANYAYSATTFHGDEVEERYVIVIGETARADNWEIMGYCRPTNPRLSKRSDLIVADQAYSESNTTHKSVPMMLTCVDAHTFETELHKAKSLITAFKEAGFHTTFISNQMPNHSYIDFFGYEADTTIFVKSKHNQCKGDDNLIPYIETCLGTHHNKQLIVVHTYGSHFNYRDRYYDQDRIFVPDAFNKVSKKYRTELLNAYDNSIVATDRLLDSIIEMLSLRNCASGLLYASDHGEDIFEDGTRFLHASPYPTKWQLHVPLFVWLSPQYIGLFPDIEAGLRENCSKCISTSRSFCPTAMAIGGIESEKANTSDDLTSQDYTEQPLYYLNDHNMPLPLNSLLK